MDSLNGGEGSATISADIHTGEFNAHKRFERESSDSCVLNLKNILDKTSSFLIERNVHVDRICKNKMCRPVNEFYVSGC